MGPQVTVQQYYRTALACVFACGLALGQGGLSEASAGAIYSYTDDKGHAVYTDKLETIPEQYRAKVKVQQTINDRVKAIGSKGGSGITDMDVRNFDQETILNYAGAAAVFLLLVIYVCKNSPMIRLLALGLLFVLGVGTPLLMYTSTDGILDVMKQKAAVTGQAQQNRLQQGP